MRQPRLRPLHYRDYIPKIRSSIRNSWQQQWDVIGPNKMKEITNAIYPWQYPIMPRRWEITLCRLRIGHTRLTHGYLMAGDYQPFCDDCLVPLTVRHLLVECPSLGDLRDHIFAGRTNDDAFGLRAILGKDCLVEDISRFLEEAGFLHEI